MLKNKKPVCSIKHFEVLTKQFTKIATRVIHDYEYNKYYSVYNEFAETKLKNEVKLLLNTYKSNMYKTKSCYKSQVLSKHRNNFWVSYTFENDEFKRTENPTKIVFRLYTKTNVF
jgi:methanogenic corrinoid protein MtbC1